MKRELDGYEVKLAAIVEQCLDGTLLEYCDYWGISNNRWVDTSKMCRALQKQKLTGKKRL